MAKGSERKTEMAVIQLVRKSNGGRSTGSQSDLRVYATRETPSKRGAVRYSIGLRVSESTMKRLRWLVGDYVSADFDDEAKTWTVRRVADKKGNALSGQGKGGKSATVRFAVEQSQLAIFGLDVGEGYDSQLIDDDGDCAVFAAK
jgi:hypothetical protein